MTMDEFAEMTQRVIARDGIKGYLPTACYPNRRHITVLEGLPAQAKTESAVLEWAASGAVSQEEHLVAFKVDESHFKIVRRIGPYTEEEVFTAAGASRS